MLGQSASSFILSSARNLKSNYFDNNSDLEEHFIKILKEVDIVMNIRTDFDII